MTDRTSELVNLVIDGEATRAERAELEEKLTGSTEVRATLEELRQVAVELEKAAAIEPPPSLKEEIMARIRAAAETVSRPSAWQPVTPIARRRRNFAVAAALAASVVLVFLLNPDLRHRTGVDSIGRDAAGALTSTAWTATQRLSTDDQRLSVIVRQRDELVRIEPALQNGSTVDVRWNPEALTLLATGGNAVSRSRAEVECTAAGCQSLTFRFRGQNRAARLDLLDRDERKLGVLVELK